MRQTTALSAVLTLVLVGLLASITVHAAGPIGLGFNGLPLKWNNQVPVPYNVEPGNLSPNISGSKARTLLDQAFRTWTGLPAVQLSSVRATDLSSEVTPQNLDVFINKSDGITPVILDETGAITDELLGAGASKNFLGAAAPEFVNNNSNIIAEGIAIMNGSLLDTQTDNAILTVMVHELGHMLGLTHSQVNADLRTDGIDNNLLVPIMFPITRANSDNPDLPATPALDDEMSMGFLYPASNYFTRGGNMAGKVFRKGAEFRGANVVIRQVGSQANVVSWPSGIAQKTGGAWEAHLLPPGQYTVLVEPIDPRFTGGSSVGGFDPPPTDIQPEFFNGASEVADGNLDDPTEFTKLTVNAGVTVGPVNIQLSDGTATLNPGAETSGKLERRGVIRETGGILPEYQFQVPVGASTQFLTLTMKGLNGAAIDVYLRNGAAVTRDRAEYGADLGLTGPGDFKTITLSRTSTPALQSGTYFVALVNKGFQPAAFELSASTSAPLGSSAATTSSSGSGSGCAARGGSAGPVEALPLALLAGLMLALRLRSRKSV